MADDDRKDSESQDGAVWFDPARLRILAEEFDLDLVVVFGSRARGDHRPDSDLDVAVRFGPQSPQATAGLDSETYRRLEEELEGCLLDPKLVPNIAKLNGGEVVFRAQVADDGIVRYERTPGDWFEFRRRAYATLREERPRLKRQRLSLVRFFEAMKE